MLCLFTSYNRFFELLIFSTLVCSDNPDPHIGRRLHLTMVQQPIQSSNKELFCPQNSVGTTSFTSLCTTFPFAKVAPHRNSISHAKPLKLILSVVSPKITTNISHPKKKRFSVIYLLIAKALTWHNLTLFCVVLIILCLIIIFSTRR